MKSKSGVVDKKSNAHKYRNEEIMRIFGGDFIITDYKYGYLHDEMLPPMV